jgi:hypothetical protein
MRLVRHNLEEQMTAEPATTGYTVNGELVDDAVPTWAPGGVIEPYRPQVLVHEARERDVVDGWVAHAASVFKLAEAIAYTEFVPKRLRDNPAAVAACILAGRELELGPMTSLRHVQVVEGSPSLSAEYKRARVLSKGHALDVLELTITRCTVRGRRRGSPDPLVITFTMDDARRAGLVKPRGGWETRPRRMLFARASSEVCDMLFSDCVNGLPTTELLEDGAELPDLSDTATDGQAEATTAQRKTAQRGKARKAGSPVATARPPEPPLPGEAVAEAREERGALEAEIAQAEPAAEPDGAPAQGTGTAAMLKKIQTMFGTAFGVKSRDDKLRAVSALAGRVVASSADLTAPECRTVLDAMEQAAQAPGEGERRKRLFVIVEAWESSQRTDDGEDHG